MTDSLLIADDDEEIRNLLQFKLENGYDVVTVGDGDACWNYLDEHADDPPDLVVLDVMMPGMDGYRVLNRIDEDERFEDVAVIMLTSRGAEDDIVRGFDVGATDYMAKPFAPNELGARIKRILE